MSAKKITNEDIMEAVPVLDRRAKYSKGPWVVMVSDVLNLVEIAQKTEDALGPCAIATLHKTVASFSSTDRREANARRIVECVNACEGIENPASIQELILSAIEFQTKAYSALGNVFGPGLEPSAIRLTEAIAALGEK